MMISEYKASPPIDKDWHRLSNRLGQPSEIQTMDDVIENIGWFYIAARHKNAPKPNRYPFTIEMINMISETIVRYLDMIISIEDEEERIDWSEQMKLWIERSVPELAEFKSTLDSDPYDMVVRIDQLLRLGVASDEKVGERRNVLLSYITFWYYKMMSVLWLQNRDCEHAKDYMKMYIELAKECK